MDTHSPTLCLDPQAVDLTTGIPVDGLPGELQDVDFDGNSLVHGLQEIVAFNQRVLQYRKFGIPQNPLFQETFPILDALVPRIEPTDQPGEFELYLHNVPLVVKDPSQTLDPNAAALLEIGAALQLFPRSIWTDLIGSTQLTLLVSTLDDLRKYVKDRYPGSYKIIRSSARPAFSRIINKENELEAVVGVATELSENRFYVNEAGAFGCALEPTFYPHALGALLLHELGHVVDGVLAHRAGLRGPLSRKEFSLVSFLMEEQQEWEGASHPQYNPGEYFADSLAAFLICGQLANVENYPDADSLSPSYYTSYYRTPLRGDLWSLLLGSLHILLDGDQIEPFPFLEQQ